MKKIVVSAALPVLLSVVCSCQALHRGIPKAPRSHGEREVVTSGREPLTARTLLATNAVRTETQPVAAVSDEFTPANNVRDTRMYPDGMSAKPDLFNEDTVRNALDEDPSDEEMVDEALESERVARNAHAFSFVPLSGLIFLPGLFVGLIGTLICLSHFRKFEFVTETGLDYERRARNTLIVTSVIVVLLYALFIALILAL